MSAAQTRIRIISGKGGVGKTTVATAMGLACARAGQRVLVAELHGGDRVAALCGVAPVGYRLREVFEDFSVVDINRADAIREYILLTLKLEALYRAVFENRLVRHFMRLVPSLGELVLLGKIWYHAQERVRGRPRFDLIIVDAPATGHAIALLRAPGAIRTVMPPGPLRDNAERLHAMLVDPAQTALHVVTTPADTPVTEALALHAAGAALPLRVGTTLVNGAPAPLSAAAAAALQAVAATPRFAGVAPALAQHQARQTRGTAECARLPARPPPLLLPQLPVPQLDLPALHTLAAALAPACLQAQF